MLYYDHLLYSYNLCAVVTIIIFGVDNNYRSPIK